jgi:hypothetical protein
MIGLGASAGGVAGGGCGAAGAVKAAVIEKARARGDLHPRLEVRQRRRLSAVPPLQIRKPAHPQNRIAALCQTRSSVRLAAHGDRTARA